MIWSAIPFAPGSTRLLHPGVNGTDRPPAGTPGRVTVSTVTRGTWAPNVLANAVSRGLRNSLPAGAEIKFARQWAGGTSALPKVFVEVQADFTWDGDTGDGATAFTLEQVRAAMEALADEDPTGLTPGTWRFDGTTDARAVQFARLDVSVPAPTSSVIDDTNDTTIAEDVANAAGDGFKAGVGAVAKTVGAAAGGAVKGVAGGLFEGVTKGLGTVGTIVLAVVVLLVLAVLGFFLVARAGV